MAKSRPVEWLNHMMLSNIDVAKRGRVLSMADLTSWLYARLDTATTRTHLLYLAVDPHSITPHAVVVIRYNGWLTRLSVMLFNIPNVNDENRPIM